MCARIQSVAAAGIEPSWLRKDLHVRQIDYNTVIMSDVVHDQLYYLAESQAGYFTAAQALEAGLARSTLQYHARNQGRFIRVGSGLYRLRHFPASEFEHVVAAWLPLKHVGAVVSHASALELHGLSDIIPSSVHVTVPREKRGQRARDGVRIHTAHALPQARVLHGLPVTNPEVSIVDAAAVGEQPEQIELAVRQALQRGITTEQRLLSAAVEKGGIALELVQDLLLPVSR
jgi:predicted transcriptional regulator of viral defense system